MVKKSTKPQVAEVIRTRTARSIGLPVQFVRIVGGGYGVVVEGTIIHTGTKRGPTARAAANPDLHSAKYAKVAKTLMAERATRKTARAKARRSAKTEAAEAVAEEAEEAVASEPDIPITDAALALAVASEIDPADVVGSGPNGKVLLGDVKALVG